GQSGACPVSAKALDMFTSALGAVAGNLALVSLATGGVYLGGGIPPKMLGKLIDGTFIDGFLGKGRFRALLEAIPVRVILNQETALVGAALRAARIAR
ncbi:MAG: glucokinase, partial [Planctomycetota bacterium]